MESAVRSSIYALGVNPDSILLVFFHDGGKINTKIDVEIIENDAETVTAALQAGTLTIKYGSESYPASAKAYTTTTTETTTTTSTTAAATQVPETEIVIFWLEYSFAQVDISTMKPAITSAIAGLGVATDAVTSVLLHKGRFGTTKVDVAIYSGAAASMLKEALIGGKLGVTYGSQTYAALGAEPTTTSTTTTTTTSSSTTTTTTSATVVGEAIVHFYLRYDFSQLEPLSMKAAVRSAVVGLGIVDKDIIDVVFHRSAPLGLVKVDVKLSDKVAQTLTNAIADASFAVVYGSESYKVFAGPITTTTTTTTTTTKATVELYLYFALNFDEIYISVLRNAVMLAVQSFALDNSDIVGVSLFKASVGAKVTVLEASADLISKALAAGDIYVTYLEGSITAFASSEDALASQTVKEEALSSAMLGIVVGVVALLVLVVVIIVVVVIRRRRHRAMAHLTPSKAAAAQRTTSYNNPMYDSAPQSMATSHVVTGDDVDSGTYAELGAAPHEAD
jgi:hypothetical protein